MFPKSLSLFVLASLALACNQTANKSQATSQDSVRQATTLMVGNDADEHGCKGSAGYQWSALRNECIRIFETGIRLDPQAAGLDKSLSAFLVFASDTADAQTELFLPGQTQPMLLTKTKAEDAGTWTNATHSLTQWKGMYTLTTVAKTDSVLYEGPAVR